MWKKFKALVRKPLEGLIGTSEEPPTRWERAEQALRRAQQNYAKRQQIRPG
jgi:hypothetical protein